MSIFVDDLGLLLEVKPFSDLFSFSISFSLHVPWEFDVSNPLKLSSCEFFFAFKSWKTAIKTFLKNIR
jgi:hypothetical protein